MKKLRLLIMPLMAISLLASCGGNAAPSVDYCIVDFDTDGGTHIVAQKVEKGKTATPPATAPTHSSTQEFTFNFDGWDFDFTTPINSDITIKAKWKKETQKYRITFDAKDGQIEGDVDYLDIKYGTKYENIENLPIAKPSDEANYQFGGWALTPTDSNEVPSDYTIKDTITLYAIYVPRATATVTFSNDSANCELLYEGQGLTPGTPCTVPAVVGITLTLVTDYGDYLPIFDDGLTITGDVTTQQFDAVKQEINISIPKDGNCNIKAITDAPRSSLEEYEWSEISQISEMGLAKNYFKVYDPNNHPELSTKKVQLKYQSGNIYQTVRIIDFNKDKDPNGNNLGITFEFADLISDANGYSLASLWQNTDIAEGSNHNYLDSTIRKNLAENGRGSIMWYEKGSGTISKEYTTSVYDMLPNDLTKEGILKTTRKKVNSHTTGSWVETDVDDKLFLLSPNEMNEQTSEAEAGEAYEYYKNAISGDVDPTRIKQQIKKSDGATTAPTDITESAYGSGASYAGYNSPTEGDGNHLWLRSPGTGYSDCAWLCYRTGALGSYYVYSFAFAVAPAFCI